MLIACLDNKNWRTKFLNKKWLIMNKAVACRKTLRFTNTDQLKNLGRYLDEVKYEWFNECK